MPEKNNGNLVIIINDKNLALQPFVQRIIRKTVLAMISTLKGVEVQGDETIEIKIKRPPDSAFRS